MAEGEPISGTPKDPLVEAALKANQADTEADLSRQRMNTGIYIKEKNAGIVAEIRRKKALLSKLPRIAK